MAEPEPSTTSTPPATKPEAASPKPETPKPAPAKPAQPAKTAKPKPKDTAPPKPKKSAAAAPAVVVAPPPPPKGTVLDASGLVLGRAASLIAQRLLKGEHIFVVNSEKAVVTGSRENVLAFYRANRARGSKRTGPHYPRYPDRIFRRTVRGMLPHLKTRGEEALARLDVYIGVPTELAQLSRATLDDAKARPALRSPITLEEVTRLLGARL